MKIFASCKFLAAGIVVALPLHGLHAAVNALDSAANCSNGYAGLHGGTGFGTNNVNAGSGSNAGVFLGDSTDNGASGYRRIFRWDQQRQRLGVRSFR